MPTARPDLAKFRHLGNILNDFGNILKRPLSIWKIFEHTLASALSYWANFQCCKWPNIEKVI